MIFEKALFSRKESISLGHNYLVNQSFQTKETLWMEMVKKVYNSWVQLQKVFLKETKLQHFYLTLTFAIYILQVFLHSISKRHFRYP